MGVTNIVRNGVLFLILFTASAYGQSLEITFTVSDSGEQRELTAGMDVDATEGFDSAFDQFAPPVPPAPLSDTFDSRIIAGDEEYYRYFRPYTTEEVSYTIAYQLASGPLNIDWSDAEFPEEGLIFFRYTDNGEETEINLRESQSHTFNSITSGSGEIELIVYLDGEEPPDIPQLISPENHETDVELQPTFEWSEIEGADGYILHANVVNPSEMVIDVELTTNFYTPDEPLEPNRDFDWRVRAVKDGIEGEWSSIRRFTTGEAETTEPVPDADLSILFTVKDSSDERDLVVGLDENATDGFDQDLDQFAPPPSPSGTFDSRVKFGGEDYFRFYRPYTTEEVRFEVAWQIGQGPLSINWSKADLPEEGLVYISYVNGGVIVEVSLREGTEYTFDSFTSGSGTFELVIHLEGTDEPPVIDPPIITITSGPEQGAVIDTEQVSFSWEGSSEESLVTGYEVELSGPVEESFTTSETTYTFENLTDGGYTFRVRAQDEGDRYSGWAQRTFSVALPPPLPDVPGLVSPADEATEVSLQPELSWDQAANAETYDLQLSTESTFDTMIVDEPGLESTEYSVVNTLAYETIYYWQVRAVNESGESDWSSVWSFTTEPEPVIPPPTITITSGPEQDVIINTDQVSFSWEGSSEESVVTGYEVELSGPVEESFTTMETTYSFENLTNGEYTFRVRAQDEEEEFSVWAERVFSVSLDADPLSSPELIAPEDGAVILADDPTIFSWTKVEGATGYEIQFDEEDPVSTGSDTEFELITSTTGEKTWRVRAIADEDPGDWSDRWSFTVEKDEDPKPVPETPDLVSPENGASDVDRQPEFSWTEAAYADSYDLQLSTDTTFDEFIVNESGIEETQFTLNENLSFETTYNWRVRGLNESGAGEWSQEWSFTTEKEPVIPPPTITITSGPEKDAIIDTDQVSFSWEGSSEESVVTGYEVELSGPVEESFTTTETTYSFENLTNGEYTFRVRAQDEEEEYSEWAERMFSVSLVADPLPAPELIAPEDGAVILANDPTIFSWSKVEGATGYEIQFEDDDPVSTGSDTEFELITSTTGERTWRVRALADEDPGDWSDRWSFTVEKDEDPPPVPETPVLVTPENGASDVDRQPEFSWTEAAYAETYDLQLSTDTTFDELIVDETGLESTEYSVVNTLAYETIYYWRVRGVNESGPGEWSEIWNFTTPESPAVDGLVLVEVDGGIELVWSISGDSDADKFNIYRGTSPDQLNQYGTSSPDTRFFVIQNIPQGASFYAVTYVTSGGVESEFSNIVSYYNASQTITNQWQLMSVPLNDKEIESDNSIVYGFDRVYKSESTIEPGKGYWVRGSSTETLSIRGVGLNELSLRLNRGWNLIGSLTGDVSVSAIEDSENVLTSAPVFGYEGTNRVEVTSLKAGKGYWIHASEEGTISLDIHQGAGKQVGRQLATNSIHNISFETGQIIFSKEDIEQTIWTSNHRPDTDQLYRYLLPPSAPDPVLDVRTRPGYALMDGSSEELLIQTSGYPIGVRVESVTDDQRIYRILARDDEGNEVHFNLLPGRQVYIDREYESLRLERVHRDEAILETGIDPNYPNPFNPTTNIRYRIAETSEVMVDVYDIVGRRVATLVNSRQMPGQYTVQFDGSSLASGVYFLRIQAGSFVDVQKLTLIK